MTAQNHPPQKHPHYCQIANQGPTTGLHHPEYSDDEDLLLDLGSQSDSSEDAFEEGDSVLSSLTPGSDMAFDPVVDVAEKVLHWQTVWQLEESHIGLDTTLLL